jgi:hypothetical protein
MTNSLKFKMTFAKDIAVCNLCSIYSHINSLSEIFEEDDENKLAYTDIFQQFTALMGK